MDVKNIERWEEIKAHAQHTEYSAARNLNKFVVSSAPVWADIMERMMRENKALSVSDVADAALEELDSMPDYGGIYGAPVIVCASILSQVWKYGQQLDEWFEKNKNRF